MDNRLSDKQASDFELMDTTGRPVRLTNFRGSQNIVLVFNRSLY
jgi:peroxiredoxin